MKDSGIALLNEPAQVITKRRLVMATGLLLALAAIERLGQARV